MFFCISLSLCLSRYLSHSIESHLYWRLLDRSFHFCQHHRVNKWFQTTFRCCGFERCCVVRLKMYCLRWCCCYCFCGCYVFSLDIRWNILSILTKFLKINKIQCVCEFLFLFFFSVFIQQKDVNQWIRKLKKIKKYA